MSAIASAKFSFMDKKTSEQEPLRRLLTPQQLGFWTFFLLFWAIAFHFFFTQWQQNDTCVYTAPDRSQVLLQGEECPADE